MVAHTPRGYPYPDDYQQPADSPNAFEDLAVAIDTDVARKADSSDVNAALGTKANVTYVDAQDATKADVGHTHTHMAQLIPANPQSYVEDGQQMTLSLDFSTLAPGEEKQMTIGFRPGSYFQATVQHSSTYIAAVVQDLGNGTGYVKVRNSTTATTHTNVKVHLLITNPPQA